MLTTQYVSFLRRFVAYLFDAMISGILSVILFVPLILVVIPGKFVDLLHGLLPRWPEVNDPRVSVLLWMFVIVYVLYFAVFEGSSRQATPGKMLMGMFVTDINGNRISYLRAFGRSLGRILSLITCFVGYLVALFTARNQSLHDLLAGTLVLEPDYKAAQAWESPTADKGSEVSIEDENSPA